MHSKSPGGAVSLLKKMHGKSPGGVVSELASMHSKTPGGVVSQVFKRTFVAYDNGIKNTTWTFRKFGYEPYMSGSDNGNYLYANSLDGTEHNHGGWHTDTIDLTPYKYVNVTITLNNVRLDGQGPKRFYLAIGTMPSISYNLINPSPFTGGWRYDITAINGNWKVLCDVWSQGSHQGGYGTYWFYKMEFE